MIVHNAYVILMESSHHLVILKIMTTTLTCIGSFKFLLDKLSKSTLLVLMLNPIQAAGKYAFYLVSLIRRRNNLIYLSSKNNFSFDYLAIYDGDSSASPMLGKYCGSTLPPNLVSSTNKIFIHFHSDVYVTESGFHLEYNPQL